MSASYAIWTRLFPLYFNSLEHFFQVIICISIQACDYCSSENKLLWNHLDCILIVALEKQSILLTNSNYIEWMLISIVEKSWSLCRIRVPLAGVTSDIWQSVLILDSSSLHPDGCFFLHYLSLLVLCVHFFILNLPFSLTRPRRKRLRQCIIQVLTAFVIIRFWKYFSRFAVEVSSSSFPFWSSFTIVTCIEMRIHIEIIIVKDERTHTHTEKDEQRVFFILLSIRTRI